MRDAHAAAEAIFRAGLARVDPLSMMERVLTLDGDILRVSTESECHAYDLRHYRRVLVLGAGKASGRMALGLERVLGDRWQADWWRSRRATGNGSPGCAWSRRPIPYPTREAPPLPGRCWTSPGTPVPTIWSS